MLVIKTYKGRDKHGHSLVEVECVCGNKKIVRRDHIVNDRKIKSCGCYLRSIRGTWSKKHGHTINRKRTRTYSSWSNMIKRCTNEKSIQWKDYGGRGIKVCARWRKFENFLEDMGERPDGRSIDRINNNANYCKRNCRWSTPKQQNNNQRARKKVIYD